MRFNSMLYGFVLSGAIAFGASAESAWAVIFDADAAQDATIGSQNTINIGGRGTFTAGKRDGGETFRALIQFPLPGDPNFIGGTVNSATMTLTVRQNDNEQDIDVLGMAHAWTEGTGNFNGSSNVDQGSGVEWTTYNGEDNGNNPWPGGDGAIGDTIGPGTVFSNWDNVPLVAEGTPTPFTIDITSLVQAWANGAANHGLLLDSDGVNDVIGIYSRDITGYLGNPGSQPRIHIDYTPVPEPTSVVLLGIGGCAMLGLRRRHAK